MNKIEEMIGRLCPNGVDYKTLREVGSVTRGGNFQKKDFVEEGMPCIHYGQIYTRYGLHTDKTFSFVNDEVWAKSKKAQPGDVIMAVTSENIEDVCKCITWLGNGDVAVSGHTAIIHHKLNPKYLTYFFRSSAFESHKRRLAHGTKVIEVTPDKLLDVAVPVPPMEIQEEIVRVLDSFAELEAELEAELKAELEARKEQYAYYRDRLLDFSMRGGVRSLPLSEIAFYVRKHVDSCDVPIGSYIGVNELKQDFGGIDPHEKWPTERRCIEYLANDILLGNIRPYLKKMWLADRSGGTNGDVLVIRVNNPEVIPDYLYHVMQGTAFVSYNVAKSKGSKMPRGDKDAIMRFEVPIPEIEEQKHIVSILDRFNTFVKSSSQGLSAEIVSRSRQFEYYRDKLLSFKEKVA